MVFCINDTYRIAHIGVYLLYIQEYIAGIGIGIPIHDLSKERVIYLSADNTLLRGRVGRLIPGLHTPYGVHIYIIALGKLTGNP